MTDIVFGRIPEVPICETGEWETSTGVFTFTDDDFTAAIKASEECPAVRNPPIWLGHTNMKGRPTNGLPAVGWLGDIRATNNGHTLVADYEGMPGWLAEALPSSYPDRSIEGAYGFTCQLGHVHDFVITGIALLGVESPAVGVLTSLQDIAALWGVETDENGVPVAATPATSAPSRAFVLASKEPDMAKPVLATISTDDIRRAFDSTAPWDEWIREIDVDPAQIIVQTDDGLVRRPYTLSGDEVVFGDPVPVVTEYRDKSVSAQLAAAHTALGARTVSATYSTRESSRIAPKAPKAATVKETGMDPIKLRESLGLAADASDLEVQAALATNGVIPTIEAPAPTEAPPAAAEAEALPVAAAKGEDLTVTVDRAKWEETVAKAALGEKAHKRQTAEDRQRLVDAAAGDGRITIAQKKAWMAKLEAEGDEGEKVLASLTKGLVPVDEKGHADSGEDTANELLEDELKSVGLSL